jgi:hypothetical protein
MMVIIVWNRLCVNICRGCVIDADQGSLFGWFLVNCIFLSGR